MVGQTSPRSLLGKSSRPSISPSVSARSILHPFAEFGARRLKLSLPDLEHLTDTRPLAITMGLMAIPVLGYPLMRGYYMWVNRRRAAALSKMSAEQVEEERTSLTRTGDKNLTFQYGY